MKTLVIQSFRTTNVPDWIRRCLDSVRAWAGSSGFDYSLVDDSAFALCGAEYLARVGRNMRAIINLSRLELVKDAHRRGYDRAIWIDADVLVFHPELFTIDLVEGYAFARETWVTRVEDRWRAITNVNNCVFACMRDQPDLEMLIQLTRHIGVHRKIEKSLQTGTYLLTGLQQSLAFETLDNIGMFSNRAVLALAHNDEDAIAAQAIGHLTPVFAANLCASDRDPPPVSGHEADTVVDRLLETKGDVVNRWLLTSPNNLQHSRPKPGMAALFPHEVNVRLQFRQRHGYEVDLSNPRTFNERIAARKISLTDDIYRLTADKYAVRRFVADRVGEHVLIPLLQVVDKAEDLDFDALPSAFILKPTHGSGWHQIVRDKAAIDRDAIRATMRKWLRTNFFNSYFEIHYRNIPPRVVAERLLLDEKGDLPVGYMLFVFRGRVRVISVCLNYGKPEMSITRYDPQWRRTIVEGSRVAAAGPIPPPTRLGEMIEVAEKLARDFDFARIDLYCFEDRVYFGEITHTPAGGLSTLKPPDFDAAQGRMWETGEPLPERYIAANSSAGPRAASAGRPSTPKEPAMAAAGRPADALRVATTSFDRQLLQFNGLSNFRMSPVVAVSRGSGPPTRRQSVATTIELGSDPRTHKQGRVSCLMLSRNRLAQAKFAIASFRKQTWRDRELLVIDPANDEALAQWVASLRDPSIRLVRAAGNTPPQDLLGLALAQASGSYVCRWDDDSVSHAVRLEAQLAVMLATQSRLNVIDRGLMWLPADYRLSIFQDGAADKTLLCEKDLLAASRHRAREPDGAVAELALSNTASYLDQPELYLTIVSGRDGTDFERNERFWRASTEHFVYQAYDTALDRLSRCYPIADVKRGLAEVSGDALPGQKREAGMASPEA
jgi:hypothetical protein